ncbi:MAG: hypothetical protein Q9191_005663 [Dirinaria sp. TL-2023a]
MKAFIISLIFSLAFLQFVVTQDDQPVVASNEDLTSQTENADNDDTNINALNSLMQTKDLLSTAPAYYAQAEENDLKDIINALGVATAVAAQAPKTGDEGEEDNIEESFSQFTAELQALSRDLISKKNYYKLALDESTIHDDLAKIRTGLLVRLSWFALGGNSADLCVYQTYESKLAAIIESQDIRDALAESTETAFSALQIAETEFAS